MKVAKSVCRAVRLILPRRKLTNDAKKADVQIHIDTSVLIKSCHNTFCFKAVVLN